VSGVESLPSTLKVPGSIPSNNMVQTYTHTHTHTFTYIHTHSHIHTYTCACAHTLIHIYSHTLVPEMTGVTMKKKLLLQLPQALQVKKELL
jgi:hypothetical protein